jgi:O-antigen ligase
MIPAMTPKRPIVTAVNRRTIERWLRASLPYLLLAAIAWCLATGGGTGGWDLAIVGVLLAAAFFIGAALSEIHFQIVPTASTAMFLALLAWLIIDGPLRSDLELETVRVPILISIAFLTIRTIRFLEVAQRARILQGLVILGTVHGSIAIGEIIRHSASDGYTTQLARADSLLDNPNALGVVLIGTAALSARELQRTRRPLLGAALGVQAAALLLTASRLAILAALCVLGWYWMTQATWAARALLAPWAVMAVLVLAFRFVHSMPEQRLYLWIAAAERIALQPIMGHGPTPQVYDLPVAEAPPTTHVHNEILQWATEYGLIGLVLAVGTLILAFRCIHGTWPRDGWLMAAATSLLASGLTDFILRITAITIMSAALAAIAFLPPRSARRVEASDLAQGVRVDLHTWRRDHPYRRRALFGRMVVVVDDSA